jgi:excisionase family DNA binding protein
MAEKFLVTNYDRSELISMIKEAFKEELKEILKQQEKPDDYDVLLSRKDVATLLQVSLITVSKYQKKGSLPYSKLGRKVYFKKGDIMKALERPVKYQYKRFNNY